MTLQHPVKLSGDGLSVKISQVFSYSMDKDR